MTTQPDLFSSTTPTDLPHGITEADQSNLRAALISSGTWMTRAQLCNLLGWPDRKVREVAETLGVEVVRGQLGFKLTTLITRDELSAVQQSIDAFHSQAVKMEQYAHALRLHLHSLIG